MTSSDMAAAAAGRPDEQDSEPSACLAAARQVASRFTGTYGLTQVDPEFGLLFAETVDVWHGFDHETVSLPVDEALCAAGRFRS